MIADDKKQRLANAVRLLVQIAGTIMDVQAEIADDIADPETFLGRMEVEDQYVNYELVDNIGSLTVTATSKSDKVAIMRVTADFMPTLSEVKVPQFPSTPVKDWVQPQLGESNAT